MSGRLIKDTSEIFSTEYGDIIEIGNKRYTLLGHECESRFGVEDPKFWVRRAVDQETGEKKIIKHFFPESFETYFGRAKFKYFRNPLKEAQILEFVKEHPSLYAWNYSSRSTWQYDPHIRHNTWAKFFRLY